MSDISTKLTYLNTTKGLIKDTINLTGANILSTDTFRSYATKLKNAYVDIINNGIDTLYDNFPKVTAEGTEIALNNTYEAPIKLNVVKGDTQQDDTPTPDTPQEVKVVTGTQNVSVSDGTNTTNYEVNLGTLELCKINDYQDTLQKSTGKNLFNPNIFITKNNVSCTSDGIISGTSIASTSWNYENGNFYITLPSGNWLFSLYFDTKETDVNSGIRGYDENNNRLISNLDLVNKDNVNIPITLNQTTTLGIMFKLNVGKCRLQIEEGTTATEYEPYGKVWYKKANIGKLILDGEYENWAIDTWFTSTDNSTHFKYSFNKYNDNYIRCISNYFTYKSGREQNNGEMNTNLPAKFILLSMNTISTVEDFKIWLGTHNVNVYYVLQIPTYETITDTTLINQLESIKSKEYSTNITISGNLPMIINASALEKE